MSTPFDTPTTLSKRNKCSERRWRLTEMHNESLDEDEPSQVQVGLQAIATLPHDAPHVAPECCVTNVWLFFIPLQIQTHFSIQIFWHVTEKTLFYCFYIRSEFKYKNIQTVYKINLLLSVHLDYLKDKSLFFRLVLLVGMNFVQHESVREKQIKVESSGNIRQDKSHFFPREVRWRRGGGHCGEHPSFTFKKVPLLSHSSSSFLIVKL